MLFWLDFLGAVVAAIGFFALPFFDLVSFLPAFFGWFFFGLFFLLPVDRRPASHNCVGVEDSGLGLDLAGEVNEGLYR